MTILAALRSAGRSRALVLAALYLGAALVSGFTLLRGIDPFDEGLMLQAARRIASGELPYRDFVWPYGPGQPFLIAGSFELTGTSLVTWRLLRTAIDAAVAVTVYLIVRRGAPAWIALLAWLAAATAMAQPASANPFLAALLLALVAVALLTREEPGRADVLLAGGLCGLAAAFRPDFALAGVFAGLAALALRPAPGGDRARALGLFGAAVLGVAALAFAPLAAAAGPGALYEQLVATGLREGGQWRLPFPLVYDGPMRLWPPGSLLEDGKDVLGYYVPLLAVAGLALALAAWGLRIAWERQAAWRWAGLAVLSAGLLLYLLSRTDEFHATPLVVAVVALLPLSAVWLRLRGAAVALQVGIAAVFGLLLAHGVANRASALLLPPPLTPLDVEVADGVKVPPAEAAAIERTVAAVQARVPPGEPIFVATARSDLVRLENPLLYALTERESLRDSDAGLRTGAEAQRRLVAALRRARPRAIVRWTDPISTEREPNPRGRPTGVRLLDLHIARDYRLLARFGHYDVLVPRE